MAIIILVPFVGLNILYLIYCGPGKLSRYSYTLRAGWFVARIPVVARFSAPVHTGPGTHPTSYKMGTGSLPRR